MEAFKTCSKCGTEKSISEFGKRTSAKDGKNEWCRACSRESSNNYRKKNREVVLRKDREYKAMIRAEDPARHKEVMKRWYEKNREKMRTIRKESRQGKNRFTAVLRECQMRSRKFDYAQCNATAEELEFAFNGKCCICCVPELELKRRLHMDHDHATGEFRGWLCSNCNRALGHFQDSEEILVNALHYLMNKNKVR